MPNKISNLINSKAQATRQLLMLSVVLFALGWMTLGTVQFAIRAQNNANTDMNLNVSAGTLDISNAPPQVNFSTSTPGTVSSANTGAADLGNEIVPNDTRGSLAGWSIIGYFTTNWLKTTDANTQMPLNDGGTLRMYWGANNGSGGTTINNITGASGDALGGANNNFPGITSANNLTLMTSNASSSTKGAGAFNMCNLKFNYNIPASASATNYTTRLKLTIA
jgi:hypothetical protein